jgi:hypothetical protein
MSPSQRQPGTVQEDGEAPPLGPSKRSRPCLHTYAGFLAPRREREPSSVVIISHRVCRTSLWSPEETKIPPNRMLRIYEFYFK